MNPYIQSIAINLFGGIFNNKIKFQNGLNIISGENGTGKTQVIQRLKNGEGRIFSEDNETSRIVVFNPLRNAEKNTQEQIFQSLRSRNLSIKKINEAFRGFAINDSQLASYSSFGDLFNLTYEDINRGGGITIEGAVNQTRNAFNDVLREVFPGYEIVAGWNNKELQLSIKKQGNIEIPINSLSRGESEAFALLFNIYANKNEEDIFLIDEPELHLNWDLERGLFKFLNWFCEEFNKQIIVATHSRIIFEKEFLPKAQFLVWENGHIIVKDQPTQQIRKKIGGDALQLITAFEIGEPIFYVEDERQKQIVEFLIDSLDKKAIVIVARGRTNVINMCRLFTQQGVLNAFFLVDGDNEGVPREFKANKYYIQLNKYSIENYFLDIFLLTKISSKDEKEIKNIIWETIKDASRDKHTKVFKKLAEITNDIPEEILDTYKAKDILDSFSKNIGFSDANELIDKFLEKSKNEGTLSDVFGEITKKIEKL